MKIRAIVEFEFTNNEILDVYDGIKPELTGKQVVLQDGELDEPFIGTIISAEEVIHESNS